MINEILIKNFKSYKDATLKLAPLTLLVGANASGKSNAIEAIRFLSWLAEGRYLDNILDTIQQDDIAIRGFSRDLIYDQACTSTMTLGCSLTNTEQWKRLEIILDLEEDEVPSILAESVCSDIGSVPLYAGNKEESGKIALVYNNFAYDGTEKASNFPLTFASDQMLLPQFEFLLNNTFGGQAATSISQITNKFQNALRSIFFFDPNPRDMAGYNFITDSALHSDGSNISSILYRLCEKDRQKEEILDLIRSLPEQDITDIRFIHTPRHEVMVQLTESFGEKKINRDAPLLSDGTLRILGVAAALLSAAKGSLIVLEEIDNGIHPSRAALLLQNIQRVAVERELHVLLTSHNPALLDSLPDSAIPNVVFCYRDPTIGDSRLIRLEDLNDYPELVAQGPLGQLLTTGIIDRYAKHQRDPAQKRSDAKAWLESLKAQIEAIDV